MNELEVAAGIVWDRTGRRILIAQRRKSDARGGEWEFPGGTLKPGETLAACLARELREELGIEVQVERELGLVEHAYPDVRVALHAFSCRHIAGTPHAIACEDWRWVRPSELLNYSLTPPDRHLAMMINRTGSEPDIERNSPTQQPTP